MTSSRSTDRADRLLENMLFIRRFEERLVSLFSQGKLKGTTHSCVGQEAVAVAIGEALGPDDCLLSNHRGHGHFLAYGGPAEGLLLELMGHPEGICAGRGGSQHLQYRNFYSNGITGGMTPVATGLAWGRKLQGSDAIVVLCIGDGALGQGVVYESLNLASLQGLPILFAVENNHYAMSTPVARGVAGRPSDRGRAFGIDSHDLETGDVVELAESLGAIVATMRKSRRPAFVVFDTYRHDGHSKSDPREYRTREEEARRLAGDAITLLSASLPAARRKEVEARVERRIDACYAACLAKAGVA
jgi:TPP-dependent pyruvate/acetoin dehydrogenase alpha subunit